MLILTRKAGQSFYIGDGVKVTIVEVKGNQIRVGIEAPKELRIYREEIYNQILEENRKAALGGESVGADLDSLSAAWKGKVGTGGAPLVPKVKAVTAAGVPSNDTVGMPKAVVVTKKRTKREDD